MHYSEQHTMQLERTFPSGEEEWSCPICNRRFLVQWPPNYKKTILEPGDEHVAHSGGKTGAFVRTPAGRLNETMPLSSVWQAAIDSLDFSGWPDEAG